MAGDKSMSSGVERAENHQLVAYKRPLVQTGPQEL